MANSDIEKYGLIGKNISYSFSKKYFTEKFLEENLPNFSYENFDIQDINELQSIVAETLYLKGLNVTIPYKESVFPFLDKINKNEPVVIHCQSGARAAIAYSILVKNGFENILNYSGGINDWVEKKNELVK